MTTRVNRIAILLSAAGLVAVWILTIDGHFLHRHERIDPHRAADVANHSDASWQEVAINALDGAPLRAWLFTPRHANRRAVLFVHGRGGTRHAMLARAQRFLRAGYTCLLIDQRGSGASGGVFSFGIHEPKDLARWARWLHDRPQIGAVFAYGASRGATTLIQSLGSKPPLAGLAVESAGVGNVNLPYQVVGDRLGISAQAARFLSWPLIEPSFAWVRVRHGFDLRQASSGLQSIRSTGVRVLIFQGADDENTPLAGAMQLQEANPGKVELVIIPNADHDWFSNGKPEVIGRILAWFEARPSAL